MKLLLERNLGGVRYESVTHYGFNDKTADRLAAHLRNTLRARVRVLGDSAGFRHVFVEKTKADAARDVACSPEWC